jgi:hypothetical protein
MRDLARRAIGIDHNEARDPAHPLSLVGGVPARPDDESRDRLVAWQRCDLVEADRLSGRRGEWASERAPDLLLDARVEHRAGPGLDPRLEHGRRQVEEGAAARGR